MSIWWIVAGFGCGLVAASVLFWCWGDVDDWHVDEWPEGGLIVSQSLVVASRDIPALAKLLDLVGTRDRQIAELMDLAGMQDKRITEMKTARDEAIAVLNEGAPR